MICGAALIVTAYDRVTVAPATSVTVTVGLNVPVALGVPVTVPFVVLIDNPLGSPVALHVYGAVPVPAVTLTGVPG